jgi:hypothetical protein
MLVRRWSNFLLAVAMRPEGLDCFRLRSADAVGGVRSSNAAWEFRPQRGSKFLGQGGESGRVGMQLVRPAKRFGIVAGQRFDRVDHDEIVVRVGRQ